MNDTIGLNNRVTIRRVRNIFELRKFIKFKNDLYSGNKFYVPPLWVDEINILRRDKNPAFEYCEAEYWIAYKNGKIVGRIAGIINHRYIKKWENKYARFGWVDFIDDYEVSEALIKTIEIWAKEKGMTGIHGPLGFCDMDKEGLLVDGFEELGNIVSIYNYSYYKTHFEKFGYIKDVDWIEFEIKKHKQYDTVPETVEEICKIILEENNLKIPQFKNKKDLEPYVRDLFMLYNEAYANLYASVHLTDAQIDSYAKQYMSILNPDYVKMILDSNDKVVAFAIATPSLSIALQKSKGKLFPTGFIYLIKALKKSNKHIDLQLVAVRPDLQSIGLHLILIAEMSKEILKNGIERIEAVHALENNIKSVGTWKYFETRQHKRRRCFIKYLT